MQYSIKLKFKKLNCEIIFFYPLIKKKLITVNILEETSQIFHQKLDFTDTEIKTMLNVKLYLIALT
jgi:hypothetical protein